MDIHTHKALTTTTMTSVAILAQVATIVQDVSCQLVSVGCLSHDSTQIFLNVGRSFVCLVEVLCFRPHPFRSLRLHRVWHLVRGCGLHRAAFRLSACRPDRPFWGA